MDTRLMSERELRQAFEQAEDKAAFLASLGRGPLRRLTRMYRSAGLYESTKGRYYRMDELRANLLEMIQRREEEQR